MSENNDSEMMEDVSLEDGESVQPVHLDDRTTQTAATLQHATAEQPLPRPPAQDEEGFAKSQAGNGGGESAVEASLSELEIRSEEEQVASLPQDRPLPPQSVSSPPPVPEKSGHPANGSVSNFGSPSHQNNPSISVTPGDGSIYRAGTPATASRTSFSSVPHLSLALIKPGLELIAQSKEAKRSPALLQASQRALDLCQREGSSAVPRDILEPLKLACELQVDRLVSPALDLIAKLVSHGFFSDESDASRDGPSLADIIVHIITTAYTETSSAAVSVQVVKSLLAIVLSTTLSVHQSSLLKAVRTVYNVYLLSPDPTTQLVAQGSLTQMIHHIFGRVKRNGKSAAGTPSTPHARSGSVTPWLNGNGKKLDQDRDGAQTPRAEEVNGSKTSLNGHVEETPAGNSLTL
jgi:brefeldin A-inhibited guanine nucleotide-exchange protein